MQCFNMGKVLALPPPPPPLTAKIILGHTLIPYSVTGWI